MVGKSATLVSASLTANWLMQSNKPTQQLLNNFLTENGFNAGGGYYDGGSVSYTPSSGGAWGVGAYTPQIGASYNYTPTAFDITTNIKWLMALLFLLATIHAIVRPK